MRVPVYMMHPGDPCMWDIFDGINNEYLQKRTGDAYFNKVCSLIEKKIAQHKSFKFVVTKIKLEDK